MFTAGAADWVVVGAAAVVDVVGEAGCRAEWHPHITAPSSRVLVSLPGSTRNHFTTFSSENPLHQCAIRIPCAPAPRILFTDTTNIE